MTRRFNLKFRHIISEVRVIRNTDGYFDATIAFPKAYIFPEYNHKTIRDILADDIEKACEIAATQLKMIYQPLDQYVREIGTFNFFVHRMRFKTAILRQVGDEQFSFVITKTAYAFSENIDGEKFFKSRFWNRENLNTINALFLINYEQVFHPLHVLGFNHKFINRLLHKHNKIKANRLRIFDDKVLINELIKLPGKLHNHVSDNRLEFYVQLHSRNS